MKKSSLVLVFTSLMYGALAYGQSGPDMDAANQTIIDVCKAKGGTYISHDEGGCSYKGCAYIGSNNSVTYDGQNERITGGCSINDFRNKAKADYRAELDKKIKDLEDAKKQADKIGAKGGDNSGYVDAGSNSGSNSGATSGATSGSSSGSNSGVNSGVASGSNSGASSGANSGDGDGPIVCTELEGEGVIEKGGLCYNECRPRRSFLGIIGKKKEGFERKSCVECLLKYPNLYHVKKEFLPKDKNGKVIGDSSVNLGRGATVKTGVIVCKDKHGNVVSTTSEGSVCPAGSFSTSGSGSGGVVVSGGIAAGSHGGTVVVSGGVHGDGNLQLPDFCYSDKRKDKKACEAWIQANRRFLCASGGNAAHCMGDDYYELMARYNAGADCVNCGSSGGRKQHWTSGVAEILGAIAPPLAYFGSSVVTSNAYVKGQEAWAGAAGKGFEQCQLNQKNYLAYLQANELPGLTPEQQAQMNCNGYQLNGYAGLNGGMYNPYINGGYSPGFISGMMGPYGMYNPYGMGVGIGGIVGGVAGGMYPGMMAGGYVGGMYPGMVNGISLAGGVAAGMPGGYVAGGMTGGYVGGYPGGMAGGYVAGGYVAGGMTGGYVGGYPGGMAGGYVAGGYVAGGAMTGGYVTGGPNCGYAGCGYVAGGNMGLVNGISLAGGVAGGMYPGGTGYYPGGWASGTGTYAPPYYGANGSYWGATNGFGNPQVDYMASSQASMNDRMLQQQGLSYQMGMGGGGYGGYGGGYGGYSAGMYPLNMGGFDISGRLRF